MQDRESELPRIHIPRTSVNKPAHTPWHPLATTCSRKNHSFRGCADPHNLLRCPCGRGVRPRYAHKEFAPMSRSFVVRTFLIGCVVVLMAGASGVQAQDSKNEEARCEGTRKINVNLAARFTSNDLPGCPQGGLLLGTDKTDSLAGEKGDDEVRSLGAKDYVMGGPGNDVIYGGADNDGLNGDGSGENGNDIIYGGPGDDDVNVFIIGDDGNDVIYAGPGA